MRKCAHLPMLHANALARGDANEGACDLYHARLKANKMLTLGRAELVEAMRRPYVLSSVVAHLHSNSPDDWIVFHLQTTLGIHDTPLAPSFSARLCDLGRISRYARIVDSSELSILSPVGNACVTVKLYSMERGWAPF